MMKLRNVIGAILFAITPFTSTWVAADGNANSVEQELHQFNEQYNEIAAAYNIDAFLSLYVEKPLWIAPEKAPAQGLDVPKATFEFFSGNEGSLSHTVEYTFASEDGTQAVMVGQYDLKVEKLGVIASGTYQFVLARDGDSWKIVTDMYNQHAAM